MYCPNCKRYAGKENDFCKKCGTFIPSEDSEVAKYADYKCSGDKGLDKMPDSRKYTTLSHTENNSAPKILPFPNKQLGLPGTSFPKTFQNGQEQRSPNQNAAPVFRKDAQKQKPLPALLIFIFIVVFFSFVGPLFANLSAEYENEPIFEEEPAYNFTQEEYFLIKPDILSVALEGTEKVKSFAIKFTGFDSFDDNTVSAPGLTAKGTISIDGFYTLDVILENGTITIPDCDFLTSVPYTIDYIELESEDESFTLYMPDGFTEVIFRVDGKVDFK